MSRSGGSPYHVTYRMMHVITIMSLRSVYIIPSRIFTVRNEVVKVIFLHLSVILSTGGVCRSACWDTTPTRRPAPPPRSRHPPRARSPQDQAPNWTRHPPREQTATVADGYASYWNAFLLYNIGPHSTDPKLGISNSFIPFPSRSTTTCPIGSILLFSKYSVFGSSYGTRRHIQTMVD